MVVLSGNLGNLDYDSSDSEKGEISKKAAENESRDGDRQRERENDKGKIDYGKLRSKFQFSKFKLFLVSFKLTEEILFFAFFPYFLITKIL